MYVLIIWICILANSIKKFVRNGYIKKIGFVVSVEMSEVDISILIGGDHMWRCAKLLITDI